MRNRVCGLALLLLILWPQAGWPDALAGRKPLVYGISQRPFPAIAGVGYDLARAEAWLASLTRAAGFLPDLSSRRLSLPGPDPALATLAICALISPLDVVTPPNAPGNEIRVFRKWPAEPLAELEKALASPRILELEMAIIWEMARAVADLRQIWPDSVAAAALDSSRLERMRELLEDLWRAQACNADAFAGRNLRWSAAFSEATESALILLAMACEDPARLQGPLEQALAAFMRREVAEPDSRELWKRLASQGLYLRGLEHQRAGQSGLARADFGAALARLANSEPGLAAAIHIARGELDLQAGAAAGMCADFAAACSLGQCSRLAQARREGSCLAQGQ